jgi:hypothetical protein
MGFAKGSTHPTPTALSGFRQYDMHGGRAGGVLAAAVTELHQVKIRQQAFAAAEQHGRNRKVHGVDQPGFQILPDRRGAAADPDVARAGGFFRALQRCVDSGSEALYSITSSARERRDGGTVIPRAFAVLRLIVSSSRVGCSTGRSPGLAPSRIRLTKWPAAMANCRKEIP